MNEELINETESKYTYTNNKPTTEVLVLWRCSQINHIMTLIWHIVFNIPYFSSVDKSFQYVNEYTCENIIYIYPKFLNSFNRNVILNTILN